MRPLALLVCWQLVFLPACATMQKKQDAVAALPTIPTTEEALAAAKESMPPEPAKIAPEVNWAMGLEETEDHPAGILISEEKAAQASEYAIRYQGIRDEYTLKSASWMVQEAVYQKNLAEADREIQEANKLAKRTWLEKNDAQLGFLLGGLLTGALVIGFQAALNNTSNP